MTTLDSIRLVGLRARGFHGVLPQERQDGQDFLVDVVVHLDTRRAAATDDLAATVDYGVLAQRVVDVVAGEPFDLIETLAEHIAAVALDDALVQAVDVTVHKPSAPIAVPFADVEVRVSRSRDRLPAATVSTRTASAAAPVVAPAHVPELAPDQVPDEAPPGVVAGPVAPGAAALPPVPLPTVATAPAEPGDRLDARPAAPVNVVLALGANLGDPTATLRQAVHDLDAVTGLTVEHVGPLARTLAVGGPEQPDFFNTVVVASTTLSPREVLDAAHAVEQHHGRERLVHWGPRTLDVDIVAYGTLVAVADDLEIPHPRAHERAFVLLPWSFAEPGAELLGLGGGPVSMLAETAPDREGVRSLALDWLTAGEPSAPSPDGAAAAVEGLG